MSIGLLFSQDDLVFYIFPTHRHAEAAQLIELIEDHGGEVCDYHGLEPADERLTRAEGIALIDPTQLYAPKLLAKRSKSDPDGEVVLTYLNWGFPQLCVDNNELINYETARKALVFCRGAGSNGSWCIFFSEHLGWGDIKKEKTTDKIWKYGGSVVHTEDLADVVIVPDDNPEVLTEERKRFEYNPRTRVETSSWLWECTTQGYVKFTPPPVRRMPGRRPGSQRVEFTPEDDKHLADYIAANGRVDGHGLQGLGFYTRLYNSGPDWAKRHTPHSWKSRYQNNREDFDARIKIYRTRHPELHRDNHGRDARTRSPSGHIERYFRAAQPRVQNSRATQAREDDEYPMEDLTRQVDEEEEFPPRRLRRSQNRPRHVVNLSDDEQERHGPLAEAVIPEYESPSLLLARWLKEELAQIPMSTPPRQWQTPAPTQGPTVNTVTSKAAKQTAEEPLKPSGKGIRPLTGVGRYGVGGDSEPEEEENTDEAGVEANKPPKSARRAPSEVTAEVAQHLDMVEMKRRRLQMKSPDLGRNSHAQSKKEGSEFEEDDEEGREIPARTFQRAGTTLRRSPEQNIHAPPSLLATRKAASRDSPKKLARSANKYLTSRSRGRSKNL
ncbi:hypothetical protein FRC17_002284 [Serendipita sp. 399]|nr:hypothetical protein FRC17_002284 [Serendipita sp. 399]